MPFSLYSRAIAHPRPLGGAIARVELEGKGNNRLVSSRTSFSGPGLKKPRRVPKMRQQTSNVDIHQAEPLDWERTAGKIAREGYKPCN